MEVATKNRIGYKKTKLGWIPEDWSFSKLGNLGQFLKGKGVAKSEIIEAGIPCVRYGEIYTYHNDYIKAFTSFISEESANQSIKLEVGDILFAGSGETLEDIGKSVAFVDEFEAYAGGDIIILRGHDQDPKFLGFLLNSDFVSRQTFQLGQGHSVVHIYSSGLKDVKIPLPPLPEQKKIAAILSTWDKAIDILNKLISEKEQLKNGLMQQLLTGKKRFAGFTGKWKEVKISEIGEVQTGNTPSKKDDSLWGGDQPWATADDMGKKYIIDTEQKLSNKGFKKARIAKAGSILVTCIASIGKNAITKIDCGFNQQINAISPNSNFDSDFIFYLIEFNTNVLLSFAGAGAMPMLNKGTFVKIKLTIPTFLEQQKIASVLSAADKEIALLRQELTNLTDQKKGLMQKLLTGEVRVKMN